MSDCLPHVVIAGLTKKYTAEDFRQLINDKAKDPEIYTYQQLVEELHYNTGDAFAFVKLNSEEAANCLIARLNESKLEGCSCDFYPKVWDCVQSVTNALLSGNSVDEAEGPDPAAEGPDPCGGPLDGSCERRGHGWAADDSFDDYISDRFSWFGWKHEVGITDDSIKRKGWGTEEDNVESCGTDSSAPVKKYEENNGQQDASEIKEEREGRVYLSESCGVDNKKE